MLNPYQSPNIEEVRDRPADDYEASETEAFQPAYTSGLLARLGLGLNIVLDIGTLSLIVGGWIAPEMAERHGWESWIGALYSAMTTSRFVIAVPFTIWEYRTYRNLSALGHRSLDAKPVWVVLAWFVPIVNWFAPYEVMEEIYVRSNPSAGAEGAGQPSAGLVRLWWGAWMVGVFLSAWMNFLAAPAETDFAYIVASIVDVTYLGSAAVAAALAILLISNIEKKQLARFRFLSGGNEDAGLIAATRA